MTTALTSDIDYVVLDSNVLIALCAKEESKYASAQAHMAAIVDRECAVYAPAVAVAECMFVLCRLHDDGSLNDEGYSASLTDLSTRLSGIQMLPGGDMPLVERAVQLSTGYGCSRSADGLFLALAEALAGEGGTELVTFDRALATQARDLVPGVQVSLLTPTTP